MFIDLIPAGEAQPALFDPLDDEPTQALMRAMDALNRPLRPAYGRLCRSRHAARLGAAQRVPLPALHDLLDELLIARDLPRRISGFPLIRQINLALILFEKMSDPNYYDTQIWRGYSVSSR
jgi:hypothetical protein